MMSQAGAGFLADAWAWAVWLPFSNRVIGTFAVESYAREKVKEYRSAQVVPRGLSIRGSSSQTA